VTVLLRLALRDLRHQRGFALFFIANLALGLAGAMVLDGLQGSIDRALVGRSQSLLGADLRLAGSRAPDPEETARLENALAVEPLATSDLVQLYSMVRGSSDARLTEVRAIDRRFPLRGAIVLRQAGVVGTEARRQLRDNAEVWVDATLLAQLGVEVGDTLHVGERALRVADVVERDTGLSVRAASLAPRLYMAREHLESTGLVRTGSRIEYQRLWQLPEGSNAQTAATAMRAALGDANLSVTSHEESAQRISSAYERVTRYLSLVTLIALALAAVACSYLFRAFLGRRVADLAILMSVGATLGRARRLLVLELLLLGAASALVAATLATLLLPLVGWGLGDVLPESVSLRLGWRAVASALLIAVLIGPLACLAPLARLGRLRVAELFQEHAVLALEPLRSEFLWYLPSVTLVAALAIVRTGDVGRGLSFVAMLITALAVIALLGRGLLLLAGALERRGPVALRLALRQLAPRRRASLTGFVALAACAMLLSLPPQMRTLLDRRLAPPPTEAIPSLFLFDIQPEQTGPLREHVLAAGTALQRLAPMVRSRLLAINTVSVDEPGVLGDGRGLRDRERLRTRRYNLTWQAELAPTETMIAGRDFKGSWNWRSDEPAEMSMEEEYARDLGVGLGDTLRFDVQGIEVEGRIVNLRRVDWNSMQPNFFVSFQPGVLEEAPAVYLASVAGLPDDRRQALQLSIVEKFANVSIIDVSRGVARMLGLIDQMQWALAATALTSLAVGLALVFAIAADEAQVRRWDVNLLKVLGARHGLLRTSLDLEFGLLGLAAALVGVVAAAAMGAAVAVWLLEVQWSPAWRAQAALLFALPLMTMIAARLAMRRVLRERPTVFLA
jgi:putative ABC transport system permease protein